MSHFVHIKNLKANRRSSALLINIAASLTLAACTSTPPPIEAIKASEDAITTADQALATEYAAPELNEAREKLNAARKQVKQENNEAAKRLAEESRIDAELALAKSDAAKAKAVNDELKKSITAMKEEMQRKTGDQQ